jgi:hypothetical protein
MSSFSFFLMEHFGKSDAEVLWQRFPTGDRFLELFVSVNSGKVKLHVQLRIVAFPHVH